MASMAGWDAGPFLIAAAPGAGKTRPALELARELLRSGKVGRVAVVCPTTPLTRQWAAAAARLGVHLQPDASELRPPRDFDGVAVTYARGGASGERGGRPGTPGGVGVAPEAPPPGGGLPWGGGVREAFPRAARG